VSGKNVSWFVLLFIVSNLALAVEFAFMWLPWMLYQCDFISLGKAIVLGVVIFALGLFILSRLDIKEIVAWVSMVGFIMDLAVGVVGYIFLGIGAWIHVVFTILAHLW